VVRARELEQAGQPEMARLLLAEWSQLRGALAREHAARGAGPNGAPDPPAGGGQAPDRP
jgi:hypothetical protein